jgi:hypothetical protein
VTTASSLFDFIPPVDPSVPSAAVPRLSRQSLAILDRLRKGPATNTELAGITHRFGARKFDLVKAGYDVRIVGHDAASGLVRYALFENGVQVEGE